MLVLSRKPGDAIVIGGGVRIRVLRVEGKQVRLGIEAPDDVAIVRAELLIDGVEAETLAASVRGR